MFSSGPHMSPTIFFSFYFRFLILTLSWEWFSKFFQLSTSGGWLRTWSIRPLLQLCVMDPDGLHKKPLRILKRRPGISSERKLCVDIIKERRKSTGSLYDAPWLVRILNCPLLNNTWNPIWILVVKRNYILLDIFVRISIYMGLPICFFFLCVGNPQVMWTSFSIIAAIYIHDGTTAGRRGSCYIVRRVEAITTATGTAAWCVWLFAGKTKNRKKKLILQLLWNIDVNKPSFLSEIK